MGRSRSSRSRSRRRLSRSRSRQKKLKKEEKKKDKKEKKDKREDRKKEKKRSRSRSASRRPRHSRDSSRDSRSKGRKDKRRSPDNKRRDGVSKSPPPRFYATATKEKVSLVPRGGKDSSEGGRKEEPPKKAVESLKQRYEEIRHSTQDNPSSGTRPLELRPNKMTLTSKPTSKQTDPMSQRRSSPPRRSRSISKPRAQKDLRRQTSPFLAKIESRRQPSPEENDVRRPSSPPKNDGRRPSPARVEKENRTDEGDETQGRKLISSGVESQREASAQLEPPKPVTLKAPIPKVASPAAQPSSALRQEPPRNADLPTGKAPRARSDSRSRSGSEDSRSDSGSESRSGSRSVSSQRQGSFDARDTAHDAPRPAVGKARAPAPPPGRGNDYKDDSRDAYFNRPADGRRTSPPRASAPPVQQAPPFLTDEQLYAQASQLFQRSPQYLEIISNPQLFQAFQQNPAHWQSYIMTIMQQLKQDQQQRIAQSQQLRQSQYPSASGAHGDGGGRGGDGGDGERRRERRGRREDGDRHGDDGKPRRGGRERGGRNKEGRKERGGRDRGGKQRGRGGRGRGGRKRRRRGDGPADGGKGNANEIKISWQPKVEEKPDVPRPKTPPRTGPAGRGRPVPSWQK